MHKWIRGEPSGHRLRESFIQTCLSVRREKWKSHGLEVAWKKFKGILPAWVVRETLFPLYFRHGGLRTDSIAERGETLGRVPAKGVKIVPRPLSLPCLGTSRYTFDLRATIIPIRKQSRFRRRGGRSRFQHPVDALMVGVAYLIDDLGASNRYNLDPATRNTRIQLASRVFFFIRDAGKYLKG